MWLSLKQGYKKVSSVTEEYLNITTQACTCTAMETKYILLSFSRPVSTQFRDF